MTTTTTLPTPLIGAAALQDWLGRAVLIDTSFDLADVTAGATSYQAAHLPGAHYLHLDGDLSTAKTGRNGRHPLPTRETFAATIGALGITPATPVVVYDRQGAMYAARAWWMLRWLGHTQVAVLDGGLPAWQAGGGALESGPGPDRLTQATPYPLGPAAAMPTLNADELQSQLGRVCLIDARAPERFRGDVEPLDPVGGHIPGALNRLFKDNLDAGGRFLPAGQLQNAFAALLGDRTPAQVVHQCGSGVTACHNLLAMEAAGLHGARLYPGSWSEWCSDPERPVARG
ncbi:MAG: hypothetical protein RJA44_1211, partial [Pseudomonadota bacterium]